MRRQERMLSLLTILAMGAAQVGCAGNEQPSSNPYPGLKQQGMSAESLNAAGMLGLSIPLEVLVFAGPTAYVNQACARLDNAGPFDNGTRAGCYDPDTRDILASTETPLADVHEYLHSIISDKNASSAEFDLVFKDGTLSRLSNDDKITSAGEWLVRVDVLSMLMKNANMEREYFDEFGWTVLRATGDNGVISDTQRKYVYDTMKSYAALSGEENALIMMKIANYQAYQSRLLGEESGIYEKDQLEFDMAKMRSDIQSVLINALGIYGDSMSNDDLWNVLKDITTIKKY